jgi:hypothetical protein
MAERGNNSAGYGASGPSFADPNYAAMVHCERL